jgi:putative transposase
MARRYELSDAEWEAIRDEPPGKATDPGRTAADNRLFVNAVPYMAKSVVPWPDLPERFGKPNTVWKRFDRWCRAGVWGRTARAPGGARPRGTAWI